MRRMNLLPKLKQQELGYEKLFYSVAVACVVGAILMVLVVLVQFGVYAYLSRQGNKINSEIEQMKRTANKTENAAMKQKIRSANMQIEDFSALQSKTPQWSNVMAAFLANVPQSVKITSFTADSTKGEITINGYSPTRDLVIDLYNNINTDKEHFKEINYPLENVAQPTDVKFTFTFSIAHNILTTPVK